MHIIHRILEEDQICLFTKQLNDQIGKLKNFYLHFNKDVIISIIEFIVMDGKKCFIIQAFTKQSYVLKERNVKRIYNVHTIIQTKIEGNLQNKI